MPAERCRRRPCGGCSSSRFGSQGVTLGPSLGPPRVTSNAQQRPTTTARPQVRYGGHPADQGRKTGPPDPGQEEVGSRLLRQTGPPVLRIIREAGGSSAFRARRACGRNGAGRAGPQAAGVVGLRHTEMCLAESSVNGAPSQSATRLSSSSPAMRAIRSSSAGQAYRCRDSARR